MKRTIINSFLFLGLVAMLFSCEREETEEMEVATTSQTTQDLRSILHNDEARAYFMEAVQNYLVENGQSGRSGAENIVPLISESNFILTNSDGNGGLEMAIFSWTIGPNDFWTVMPDGSVNIHVNNDMADAFRFYDDDYCGSNGQVNLNYNGVYNEFTFCLPFPPFTCTTFAFINSSEATQAYTFHGSADVGDYSYDEEADLTECGTPDHKLTAHYARTSSGQEHGFIKLK